MSPSPACELAKQAGWWYTIVYHKFSVSGRVLLPAAARGYSAPRRGSPLSFVSDGLFSFSSERKEEKKRRQKLRFWISLRGFTCSLSCSLSATRTLCRIDFAKILHCLCFLERCRFCSEIQAHQLLPWLKSAAAAQTRRQSFYPHDKAKSP